MKTKISLIRHASSQQIVGMAEPDWPLSDAGKQQALDLAKTLKVDCCYASPFARAHATLTPTAENLGVKIVSVDNLRERQLAADLIPDFVEQLRLSFNDLDRVLPGGESGRQCQTRMLQALAEIAKSNLGKSIAVCSHGNAISLFLNALDASVGFETWQQMKNPDIFQLEWENDRWSWP